jgi:hypothetical protein
VEARPTASGDQTNDPTRQWPNDRPGADLGMPTIDRTVADSDASYAVSHE